MEDTCLDLLLIFGRCHSRYPLEELGEERRLVLLHRFLFSKVICGKGKKRMLSEIIFCYLSNK